MPYSREKVKSEERVYRKDISGRIQPHMPLHRLDMLSYLYIYRPGRVGYCSPQSLKLKNRAKSIRGFRS